MTLQIKHMELTSFSSCCLTSIYLHTSTVYVRMDGDTVGTLQNSEVHTFSGVLIVCKSIDGDGIPNQVKLVSTLWPNFRGVRKVGFHGFHSRDQQVEGMLLWQRIFY